MFPAEGFTVARLEDFTPSWSPAASGAGVVLILEGRMKLIDFVRGDERIHPMSDPKGGPNQGQRVMYTP